MAKIEESSVDELDDEEMALLNEDDSEDIDVDVPKAKSKAKGKASTPEPEPSKAKSRARKVQTTLDNDELDAIVSFQKEDVNKPDETMLSVYKDLSVFYSGERELVKTNILSLDLVLGKFFTGEIVEVCSPSGVGKSTLMMQICKNIVTGKWKTSNSTGRVAYIDVEGGVNDDTLEKMSLDKYLGKQFQLLSTVSTYEKLEESLEMILGSPDKFDAIIIDSITDVIPGELYEKKINQQTIGLSARYMTTLLQKFKPLIRANGTTLWLVNQMRVKSKKIGFQMKMEEDAAGPNIIAYAPDVRLRLTKGEAIKEKTTESLETINADKETQVGTKAEIWATKNRGNTPNIRVVMPVFFGRGISDIMTMKDILFSKGFLTIGGATHTLTLPNEEPIKFAGSKKFSEYLKANVYNLRDKLDAVGHWQLVKLGEITQI